MKNNSQQPENNKNTKTSNKALIIGAAVAVVLLFIGFSSMANSANKDKKPSGSSQSTAKQSSSKPVAGINQPVRDGKFEFVVTSMECGKPKVEQNEYMTKTAQGQFCLLSVTVKNVGREPQLLSDSNQKLLDAQGREFASDSMATLYGNPSGSTFFQNINPGNQVSGVIVFDVPKDTQMKQAKLYDSAFSQGVLVNL